MSFPRLAAVAGLYFIPLSLNKFYLRKPCTSILIKLFPEYKQSSGFRGRALVNSVRCYPDPHLAQGTHSLRCCECSRQCELSHLSLGIISAEESWCASLGQLASSNGLMWGMKMCPLLLKPGISLKGHRSFRTP